MESYKRGYFPHVVKKMFCKAGLKREKDLKQMILKERVHCIAIELKKTKLYLLEFMVDYHQFRYNESLFYCEFRDMVCDHVTSAILSCIAQVGVRHVSHLLRLTQNLASSISEVLFVMCWLWISMIFAFLHAQWFPSLRSPVLTKTLFKGFSSFETYFEKKKILYSDFFFTAPLFKTPPLSEYYEV